MAIASPSARPAHIQYHPEADKPPPASRSSHMRTGELSVSYILVCAQRLQNGSPRYRTERRRQRLPDDGDMSRMLSRFFTSSAAALPVRFRRPAILLSTQGRFTPATRAQYVRRRSRDIDHQLLRTTTILSQRFSTQDSATTEDQKHPLAFEPQVSGPPPESSAETAS